MAVTDEEIKKNEEIEKIRKSRENLEKAVQALPEINEKYDKLVTQLCEGDDCLVKRVENKFDSIDEKIKNIENNTQFFLCDNCGYDKVPGLSSFCPQCGSAIYEWNDDDGQPIRGWKHWNERNIERNIGS